MNLSPSHDSHGLVNLIAEIEKRLTGSTVSPPLNDELAARMPDAATYVLVLFDGLGVAQLEHRLAATFRTTQAGTLEAGFPTSTSVSLATVATALTPGQHGVVAHLAWMPRHQRVVNTLKWVDLTGRPVDDDYPAILPGPNLWERLKEHGIEPITVQPGNFETSPLTRVLYRGARFEGIWDYADLIDATVQLAAEPGRAHLHLRAQRRCCRSCIRVGVARVRGGDAPRRRYLGLDPKPSTQRSRPDRNRGPRADRVR